MSDQQQSATQDTTYNLISVIYHNLQAVDTYHIYARDAESEGDTELAGLLQEAIQQHRDLAARAKELLTQRLSQGGGS